MELEIILIKKMKKGDPDAFDQFVKKYYGSVYGYVCRKTSDIELAKDLTQDTFVRFFEKFAEYKYSGKTLNYLYTIAGNIYKDFVKKNSNCEILYDDLEQTGRMRKESFADELDTEVEIKIYLDKLKPEYRDVIYKYYFEEQKIKEIAENLSIGESLVKYRLSEAKKKLKDEINAERNK